MKSARLFPTAYQNLWHACVAFIFQCRRTKCVFFPRGTLIFQPLPPYSMLKRSRRIFQSGKISGVLKIDAYMVRRSKIWSLHRSMHPFTSTLNRGEGLLKIVTFPSRKGVFRLLTWTFEMSSEMRLYRNWRRLCRSSMDWWINLLRYKISQIFDFFLIFLDSFTWFLWLFSKKCRKNPKMSSFLSRNAYLRRDEPGIFLWASVICWHAKRARRFWYALVAVFEQQR